MKLAWPERLVMLRQAASMLLAGKIEPNTLLGMVVGPTGNPPRRRGKDLLQTYNDSPWLRAAVHKVAFACASVPSRLYTGPEDNLQPVTDRKHPLIRMVDGGIPGVLTGLSTRMLTHIYLDVLGEAFWVKDRTNALGTSSMAWPCPPHWVIETPRPDNPAFRIQVPGGQTVDVPASEMVWFKEPDPVNPYLRGASAAAALADEIQTDENAAKFLNRFFYNNARPSLIISADGLNPESTRRLEEEWNRRNQGVWNAFRAYFLNRKVDVQIMEQNLEHLQFTQLRSFERDMIIQVYGVPPEILGIIQNSNRATIEAADYMMAKWVVAPRLALFDAVVQMFLVPLYDENLTYKHDDPVPENKEMAVRMGLDANMGAISTVDERRRLLGLPALPDGKGKVFLVPLNYIAVKDPSEATLPDIGPDQAEVPPEPGGKPLETPSPPGPEVPSPPAPKGYHLKQADATRIIFDIEAALRKVMGRLRPVYRMTIRDVAQEVLKELGVTDPFNLSSENMIRFLDVHAAEKIEGILRSMRRDLRDAIAEGIEAHENLAQLAQRISEVFEDAKGARAVAIARTETGRAANFANLESYHQSGVVEKKVWLATRDTKTRESHREADGQEVDLEDKFIVGGERLDYPLDPDAGPDETVNCRCTMVARIQEKALQMTPEQQTARWKQFDTTVRSYSRQFRAQLVKAFQELQDETMDRLNATREE